MTSPIHLILGIHNHQPVDNWHHVIEEAYDRCYQPFLDVLTDHPRVAMAIHYTGYLLDWIADHHSEHLDQLRRLVARGQVEMLSGGYYEPILAMIPDADKIGQIRRLSARVEELTGCAPQGLWLAERVWEPHLVKFIAEAGVGFACLDDTHFKAAGFDDPDLFGRYVTEEQGRLLEIFPVNKTLRYRIPYDPPESLMDYLRQEAAENRRGQAAVYMDDGEKFGVWPGTHKWVYQEKWLDKFFTAIENNADVIQSVTPSQYRDRTRPIGRAYLPTASYAEMLEWAMPHQLASDYQRALTQTDDASRRFVRAGFWRHFLVKYPESNALHKKMLYVADKVRAAINKAEKGKPAERQQAQQALDCLWRGQSNDVFWHGVFGGLYLTNLRSANYRRLLEAESLADSLTRSKTFCEALTQDLDGDGEAEIAVETPFQNLYLDPAEGGMLYELDYRPKNFNLLDTLSRRPEPYHAAHHEGEGLAYDWHRRASLLDHFLGEGANLQTMKTCQFPEQGDFVDQPYEAAITPLPVGLMVTLHRDGHVWQQDHRRPLSVEKRLEIARDAARVHILYTLRNPGESALSLTFAPEFNVNLLAPHAPDRYYYLPVADATAPEKPSGKTLRAKAAPHASQSAALTEPSCHADTSIAHPHLASTGTLREIAAIGLKDEYNQIDYQLHFSQRADLWRFPIETFSKSESGFDRVYQSSALLPHWRITLAPGAAWSVEIVQIISG
ncbi:MAG: DUF1926 domain-containing protein [Vampirovibrionales bacterium]|nr:DUF1926 domain-containing protein [Vampirovibrionales bacterium]